MKYLAICPNGHEIILLPQAFEHSDDITIVCAECPHHHQELFVHRLELPVVVEDINKGNDAVT